jgi:hypothetical protein
MRLQAVVEFLPAQILSSRFVASVVMPRLPMPPIDPEAYTKNTEEQYEALGRFVEAFEAMIDDVRGISVDCIRRTVCAEKVEKPDDTSWDEWNEEILREILILEIPFHHQGATAKPLFDTMKAIIAEIVNVKNSPYYQERETYKALLSQIGTEFDSLSWKRNDLLHGTWRIGYLDFDDPTARTFDIRRYKLTADGVKRAVLPKDAFELLELRDRCNETRDWLTHLDGCLRARQSLSTYFRMDGKEWKLFITSDGVGTTLPKK